jgi:hypothetical protein
MRPVWKDVGPADDALTIQGEELNRIVGDAVLHETFDPLERKRFELGEVSALSGDDVQTLAVAGSVALLNRRDEKHRRSVRRVITSEA